MVENALAFIIVPSQEFIGGTANWISGRIEFFQSMTEMEEENARLQEEVDELRAEYRRLHLVETENKKLSELFDIDQKYPNYEKTGARIVSKRMDNWYQDFTINKGENHNIRKNMVVLASGGLVGRIFEAGNNYSKVISVIDSTSSISAKSVRTEDLGFVRGSLELMSEGLCRMDYIDIDAEIMVGDEIITSHLGRIYPPGLTIGHVVEVRTDINGFTKSAIIEPVVDLRRIESVLVIIEELADRTEELEELE